MRVTQHSVFRRFWYPVMPSQKLVTGPQPFTLLLQPLALWLDQKGDPKECLKLRCRRDTDGSLALRVGLDNFVSHVK